MTHPLAEPRPHLPAVFAGPGLPFVVSGLALAMFALMLFDRAVFSDGDTYWHLAAGEWMIAHGRILRTDPFSFTHAGQPWTTHEWLSEVLMAAAFRAWNWSGLAVLYAATTSAATVLFARRLALQLSGVTLLTTLVLAFSCAAPSLLDRPHMLCLPILILWTDQLMTAREANRAPPGWLAGVMLLWANLHGSFVFGLLLAGAFALEALWQERARPWTAIRDWSGFGALALLGALATPHGFEGLLYPLGVVRMQTLGAIVEWGAADFSRPSGLELGLIVTLMVGFVHGVRVPPVRIAIVLLLLHMALQHYRHQFVLGFLAPLLLAKPFAEALGQSPSPPERSPAADLLLACGAAALASVLLLHPVQRDDSPTTPKTALQHVPGFLAAEPVLNSHAFGGYLIFQGVRPFIDGRTDMYGDALFLQHIRLMQGDRAALAEAMKTYGLRWTILSPQEPLARTLDDDPDWAAVYRDRWAVVHRRIE